MQKTKTIRIIGACVIALIWIAATIFVWISPSKEVSMSERRKLSQLPEPSLETVLSGDFTANFEKYSLDQFPWRDNIRQIKSLFHYYVLGQKDNNDIYINDGYAIKMEYPLNQDSITHANERFNYIYKKYLQETNTKNYISIIPDKGYYAYKSSGHLALDYDMMFNCVTEANDWAQYIDITTQMNLSSFYQTDTHWRQENITNVAWYLYNAMNKEDALNEYNGSYYVKEIEKPFYGVYYGQAALPMQSETMYYLTNDTIKACSVYDYETNQEIGIYEEASLGSEDLYDYYLSGSKALLKITNPNAETDKELIIFRDSFGSSIAPLLIQDYKTVTLVDIRYIISDKIGDYIKFENQDVLFLYSTSVINHSSTLK